MVAVGYTSGDDRKLDKAGGTMTGALVLAADPAANLQAATKQYVDNHTTSGSGAVTSVNTRTGVVTGLAEDSAVVHLAGAETVAGVKTFTSAPVVPSAAFPESAVSGLVSDLGAKAADTVVVHNTGAETVAGVKTFSASPIVPTATTSGQAANLGNVTTAVAALVNSAPGTLDTLGEIATALAADESTAVALATAVGLKAVDTAVVHNTGAETIAGVKTFTSAPVVPSAAFPESAVSGLTADLGAKAVKLVPTAVKTGAYTAAASELVLCDPSSSSFTVTLPAAPADKTQIAVKIVVAPGSNAVTVACGSGDHFNSSSGATAGTLTLLGHSMLLQYQSSTSLWFVLAVDVPLPQIDARYGVVSVANSTGDVTAVTNAITAATSGGLVAGSLTTQQGRVARITTATTIALGYSNTQGADWSTGTPQKVKLSLDILPDANLGAALTIKGGFGVELDINVLGGGAVGTVTDAATTVRTTSGDGTMTSGDITNTLTSATASFVAGDVNAPVAVPGAGSGGVTLFATIATVVNSTTVTLTATAGTSVTTAAVQIGSLTVTSAAAVTAGLKAGAVVRIAGAGPSPEGVTQPLMASVRSVNAGAGTFVLSEGAWSAVTGASMTWMDVAVRLEDHVGLKLNIYGKAYAGCLVVADAADDATRRMRSVSFGRINGNQCGMTLFWKRMEAHGSLGQIWSNSVYGDYVGQCDDLHWTHYEGGVGSPALLSAANYVWFDRCNQLNNLAISVGDRASEAAVKMTSGSGQVSGDVGRFAQIRCTNYAAQILGTTTSGSNQITAAVTTSLTMKVGQTVVGAGIPDGTTIAAVTGSGNGYTAGSPGTITMSANATASASGQTIYGLTSDGVKMVGIQSVSITQLDTAKCIAGLRIVGGGGNGIRVLQHKSLTSDLAPLVVGPGATGTTPRVDVSTDYRFVLGYILDVASGLASGAEVRLSGYSEGMHSAYGATGRYAVRCASTAAALDVSGHRQKTRSGLTGFVDPATVVVRGRPNARLENDTPGKGTLYYADGAGSFTALAAGGNGQVPTWQSDGSIAAVSTAAAAGFGTSTAQQLVQNTTTATAFITYTILANTVAAGNTWRLKAWGTVDNDAGATVTIRLKVGGTSIASPAAITNASAKTAQAWNGEWLLQFRGTATSTTPTVVGGIVYSSTSAATVAQGQVSANLNMTVDRAVTVDATWSAATTTNILRCEGYLLEKVI